MGNNSVVNEYSTVMLLLSVQKGEASFLQFKIPTSEFWTIPKHSLQENDTPRSESLHKLSMIKQLTGWNIKPVLKHEDMLDLPDIAVSVCVIHVEDDATVPKEHAGIMRWTSFLSMMTFGGAEGSSEADMEIIGAWQQNKAFLTMRNLLQEQGN